MDKALETCCQPAALPVGRRWPAWAWLAVVAAYACAAGWEVWLWWPGLNPDGISYIQVARHYAAGRLDLAVTSYWGPLLSWLLTPAAALDADMLTALRVLNAVLGLGFAFGAESLSRRLGGPGGPLVLAAGAALGLRMLQGPLTPDVLLACVVTWYFVAAADMWAAPSPRRGLAAGALAGAAYLAKAYALVFAGAHLAAMAVAAILWRRSDRSRRLGALAAAGVAVAAVAGPWVAAISIHDGRPTFGSVSRVADAIISSLQTDRDVPIFAMQTPRPGRINAWENPMEIPQALYDRAAAGHDFGLNYRLKMLDRNLPEVLWSFTKADVACLLLAGSVLAALTVVLRRRKAPPLWAWAIGSALLYMAGYLTLLVEDRYYWPVWGVWLGLTAAVAWRAWQWLAARRPRPSGEPGPVRHWPWRVAMAVLVVSVCVNVGLGVNDWLGPWGRPAALWMRESSRRLPPLPAGVAATPWYEGLYACYWTNRPYLGKLHGGDADSVAAELAPFGPATLLIYDRPELAASLAADGRFRLVAKDDSMRQLCVLVRE
jgi:hypothetical protein